ncbi:MAG: hypothetical protein JO264_15490 [Acidisphaera sp.]|nr:hypothetical protein [Acidisphaera sp.]
MADRDPVQTADKRLAIHTALDGVEKTDDYDPLLLVAIKGTEDVSAPYRYTVTMWRYVHIPEHPPVPPADLIDTAVEVRVNLKETLEVGISGSASGYSTSKEKETSTYVRRCGVFETFNDEGFVLGESAADVKGIKHYIRQYTGTIVPAFKMLDYETCFRVFEQKTVVDIIKEVTDPYPYDFFLKIDYTFLQNVVFPTIPYCVQFKESTFNFLSRLMAEYGIWYYFDHNAQTTNIATMVLGTGHVKFKPVTTSGKEQFDANFPINQLTLLTNKKLDPSALTIQHFQENYNPIVRQSRFGNFNILNPIDPITAKTDIQPQRDLISATNMKILKNPPSPAPNDDYYRMESFGMSVDQNSPANPPTKDALPSAQAYSDNWMAGKEALIAKVSGGTRNCAFIPGFTFDRIARSGIPGVVVTAQGAVSADEAGAAADGGADAVVFDNPGAANKSVRVINTYVLAHVEFEGVDTSYSSDSGNLGKFITDTLFPSNLSRADLLANGTAQGVNNYLQNQLPLNLGQPTSPGTPGLSFLAYTAGGGLAAVTAAIPLLVQAVEKWSDEKTDDFHCSFVAIPTEKLEYSGSQLPMTAASLPSLPLPVAVQPQPGGPHLAVVIGASGVPATADQDLGEVYADKLGRVRVRFAWDRRKGEQPGDSFKRGDATCWVRVSEGWAGRSSGTQFLPRVGQEVIVDFIDGNVDRPIITGRVYNADHNFANLPFPEGQVAQLGVTQSDLLKPAGSSEYRFTGVKTRSMPKPSGNATERYHLVRYDDAYNCEQYLLRSQGRLDVTAFAHSFETTYGNKNVTAVKGTDPDGNPFGGNMYTTVGQEYDLHVGSNRYEQVDKDYEITVKGDVRADLKQGLTAVIKGDVSIALNSLTVEATEKITLKVGQSFIVIDHCAVYINGPSMIYENSGGSAQGAASVTMQNVADAALAEPGDQWNKRVTDCIGKAPPGGQRGTHTEQPTPAPACDSVVDGVACDFLSGSSGGASADQGGNGDGLSGS